MRPPQTPSQTFAIIKPDAVKSGAIGPILTMASEVGLVPVQMQLVFPPQHWWSVFYAEHTGEPFFDKLVDFMDTGPSLFLILSGPHPAGSYARDDCERALKCWRKLMGATDPTKAEPGTIRALYGSEMPANAVHGSDSLQKVEMEIFLFQLLRNQR